MAEFNIIKYSELENNSRIEAEFYRPQYMEIEQRIRTCNYIKLRQACNKISDGTHFTPQYVSQGIPFYSALNVKENYFDYVDKFKYITPAEHKILFKRCNPEANDILLRKVGVGPRWSCVIPEGLSEFSIFVSVALLKLKRQYFNSYFLCAFINSKYGQSQLLRIQKGVSQPDLHLEDIAEFKVPLFDFEIQNRIAEIFKAAIQKKQLSDSLITLATNFLENELGFDSIILKKIIHNQIMLSEITQIHRIDAQCYKPEYVFYESWIENNCRFSNLGNILKSTIKGKQRDVLESGSLPYVSIKDIENFEIVHSGYCNSFPIPAVKDNLLLAITGATIGKVGLVTRNEKLAFCGDLLNLIVDKNKISPFYLITVLKSKIGQTQFNRWISGATNGHLSPLDVKKILIPRLSQKSEEMISQWIKDSLASKLESERLLELAKTEVETLIEQAANAG
jgi:type I restriction enzyme, S subunit